MILLFVRTLNIFPRRVSFYYIYDVYKMFILTNIDRIDRFYNLFGKSTEFYQYSLHFKCMLCMKYIKCFNLELKALDFSHDICYVHNVSF